MIRIRYLAAVACLATLAGCETPGPIVATSGGDLERQAQQLASAGDFLPAVDAYTQLINTSTGSEQVRLLTEGAAVLIDSGNFGSARRWLTRARAGATPGQTQIILVMLATVETAEGRPNDALNLLALMTQPPSPALMPDVAAARGQALFALGLVEAAVRTLVERERWLRGPDQLSENYQLIWDGLYSQSFAGPLVATGDPLVDGWLALQPVAAGSRSNPPGLEQGLLQWRLFYPDHPAAGAFLSELLAESQLAQSYPEQLALLLPLSSLQQPVARAIRDGFIAAHLGNRGAGAPRLLVYDTTLLGTQEAYLRAQIEGADFIVGPLLKAEVEEIIGTAGFTPTLALNALDNAQPVPPNLYQFPLAPEDEAREVARHAVAQGMLNAVALIPNSEWGIRLLNSFQAELESLGGQLLQFRGYDPGSQDFSLSITALLSIQDSNQRRRRLAANLGMPLEFEPRRRQDVDVIFVAADAAAGRLLAPQLRFHYAGDLPTYATSAVYDPGSRLSNSDLNGVLFPDTPWLLLEDAAATELKAELESIWPQRASQWIRFYGMGFDAYRLVPMLYNPPEGFSSVPALSGELSLGEDGRVHRRLPLAQFRNGRPTPIDVGEELPDQEPAELAEVR